MKLTKRYVKSSKRSVINSSRAALLKIIYLLSKFQDWSLCIIVRKLYLSVLWIFNKRSPATDVIPRNILLDWLILTVHWQNQFLQNNYRPTICVTRKMSNGKVLNKLLLFSSIYGVLIIEKAKIICEKET